MYLGRDLLLSFYLVTFSISYAAIIRVKLENSGKEVFSAHCKKFGCTELDGPKGYLLKSYPSEACTTILPNTQQSLSDVDNSTKLSNWILLAETRMCSKRSKLCTAKLANYSAIILIEKEANSNQDEVPNQSEIEKDICQMDDTDDCRNLSSIFSCIINEQDGVILQENYLYTYSASSSYVIEFEEDSTKYNRNYLFLAVFGTTICMSAVWLLVYCTYRIVNHGYIWLREMISGIPYESLSGGTLGPLNLPKWVLKKLPVKIWSETDPKDICAICIEDILPLNKVRFLPCSHGFHMACIDKWLLNSSRNCPICKRKIIYLKKVLTSWNSDQEESYFRNPGSHLLAPVAFRNDDCGNDSSCSLDYSSSDTSDSDERAASLQFQV